MAPGSLAETCIERHTALHAWTLEARQVMLQLLLKAAADVSIKGDVATQLLTPCRGLRGQSKHAPTR